MVKPGNWAWHIEGRRSSSGTDKSLDAAKRKIEFYFETIQSEE
jgi:hypothetical protein